MSTLRFPPPPVRSIARPSTAGAVIGLSRVDPARFLGVTWSFAAAVFSPASGRSCGLASPTPASRHHLASV